MSGSILFQIPPELLRHILDMLPPEDVRSLRLTCQAFNSFISAVLFKSLRLEFLNERHYKVFSSTTIAPYVRILELSSASSRAPRRSKINVPDIDKSQPEDIITTYLVPFVKKLQNLHSLKWDCRSNYNLNGYMNFNLEQLNLALADIPTLKNINVYIGCFTNDRCVPDISCFKDLHSLRVELHSLHVTRGANSSGTSFDSYLRASIMPAVTASPMLRDLDLSSHKTTSAASFDALVNEFNIWGSDTTTPLKDLTLVGIPLQLSVELGRVFKHLTHLTCLGCQYDRSVAMNDIAWADIWNALYSAGTKEGLWLETLDTEGRQPEPGMGALLQYLQSHPGLKKLSLRDPLYDRVPISPSGLGSSIDPVPDDDPQVVIIEAEKCLNLRWATQFWSEILPRFAHSLQELRLDPGKQGPWSYGPKASSAIRQCTSLKKIWISISNVPEKWALAQAAGLKFENYDDYHFLHTLKWGRIETAAVLLASDLGDLPVLQEVQIDMAEPDVDSGWSLTEELENRHISRENTMELLRWFVPGKKYPYKLCNGAIIHVEEVD